jgi:hypothetical protein
MVSAALAACLAAALLLGAARAAAQDCAAAIVDGPDPAAGALRIGGDTRHCPLDEAAYARLVRDWLRGRGTAPRTLALGRVEAQPWLAAALAAAAAADRRWRTEGPGAAPATHNRLVAALLSEPAMLARLSAPFAGSGLAVVSVAAEKVLVGPASGAPPLPYDAQIWLRLAPRP